MSKILTQEEFINRAKEIHGDADILSKVVYKGMYEKITLICPVHGEYETTARNYLKGHRCPKCSNCYSKTLNERIIEANEIHGNKYDYSLVKEFKNKSKIPIICPIHGEFLQTWKTHLKGCGCPKCSGVSKKTTEEFIKEYQSKYGTFYDVSKVVYKNAHTKVTLICPTHGEFKVTPHSLLTNGTSCPHCAHEKIGNTFRLSQEEIIKKIKNIHGDKYDYSKIIYTGMYDKIELICPLHGSFWMRPHNIISGGQGCPKCGRIRIGKKLKLNTETFIEKAKKVHGDKYDYSKVNYINISQNVKIICHNIDPITGKEHGELLQKPSDHLAGCGCRKCSNYYDYSVKEYIEKANIIHNNKYDYSKLPDKFTKYSSNKITVICPKHGEFQILPYTHLHGVGCPVCNESNLEKHIAKLLENKSIKFERQKKFKWMGLLSLDFYLSEYNTAIECQGRQHFIPVDFFGGENGLIETQKRDNKKFELCKENGIRIIYFSNLKENDYPYKVIEDDEELIDEVMKRGT